MRSGDLLTGPRPPFSFDADPFGAQPQRDLFAARGDGAKRPSVAALVPRFIAALSGRGWVSGALLSRELGADLRSLREAANKSQGQVIGGNKGYALTIEAPLVDVVAVVNRHLSQSREMRLRAMSIERVRHGARGDFGSAA